MLAKLVRCACARAYGVYACGVLAVYCVAARCGECNACVSVERAACVCGSNSID